ncbi:MAG: hypothetical protein FVQ79_03835 [Planctomycetes bacterium]|nr:hypothetical protein [Planctomycetota bacterium]
MDVWKGFQIRFSCVALLLLFFCGYGFGGDAAIDSAEGLVISSIEVSGNAMIGREEILSRVQSRVGREYSSKFASQESARIGKLDGIKYSEYSAEVVDGKVRLVFIVQEQLSIRSILFLGNKGIKDKALKKATGFKEGGFLDESLASIGIGDLEKLYHKKGYANVKIGLNKASLRSGKLVYEITEGPRIRIKQVSFSGNENITSKALSKAIKTRKRKFLFFRVYYSEEVISEDIAKLKDVYKSKGYLDVEVSEETKTSSDGRLAYVEFNIVEGTVYKIGTVEMVGNLVFSDEVLLEGMRLKPSMVYSDKVAQFDADKIGARYGEQGFVDANVEYLRSGRILTDQGGAINVKFHIEEGGCFRIGLISIKGKMMCTIMLSDVSLTRRDLFREHCTMQKLLAGTERVNWRRRFNVSL